MNETTIVWREGNVGVSYNGYVYRGAQFVAKWEGRDLYIESPLPYDSFEAAVRAVREDKCW